MVEISGLNPMNHTSRWLELLGWTVLLMVDTSSCGVIISSLPPRGILNKREGCEVNKCGGVDIPYPFGIGPNCSHDPFFDITCKTTNNSLNAQPFLTHLGLRVLDLDQQLDFYGWIITVSYPPMNICTATPLVNLISIANHTCSGSPYRLLGGLNDLIALGCNVGVAVFDLSTGDGKLVRDCNSIPGNCSCRKSMPDLDKPMESYGFRLTHGDCALVGIGDENNSVTLAWTNQGLNKSNHVTCEPALDNLEYCKCESGYQGNPYLPNGCQIVEECKGCRGFCAEAGYGSDPFEIVYQCVPNWEYRDRFMITSLICVGGVGALFLVCAVLYCAIKRRRNQQRTSTTS